MSINENTKRAAKRGASLGLALALICHFLMPHDYREPCKILAKLCTGGF